MIEALVFLVAVTITALITSLVTRRMVTNQILNDAEALSTAAAKEVIEELLVNPDTKSDMTRVVRSYVAGRRKITLDKEKGRVEIGVAEYGTPEYDYPYKGVTDSAIYDLYHKDLDPEAYKKVDRTENEFYDGQSTIYDEEGFEKWLRSYDEAVSGTSK